MQKIHTGDPLGSASDWLKQIPRIAQPIKSQDLDNDVISIQFLILFLSDVISRGNQWRRDIVKCQPGEQN